MGQTHVHKYLPLLMSKIASGEVDTTFLITHRGGLDIAVDAYKTFSERENGCVKVVMDPRVTTRSEKDQEKVEALHD